jgi:arginyl-tRNA synthetase
LCKGGGSVAAAETPLPHAEDDGYNLKSMIRQQLAEWVSQAAHAAREAGDLAFDVLPAFEIETPRNPQFGDYAANLAMLLAKQARRNPREVAEAIRQRMPDDARAWVERVEVAGAGFLNFYLKPDWAGAVVRHILQRGMGYGDADARRGQARAD